jgi:hypothetical protein
MLVIFGTVNGVFLNIVDFSANTVGIVEISDSMNGVFLNVVDSSANMVGMVEISDSMFEGILWWCFIFTIK